MAIEILSSLKTSSDIKGKGSLDVDGSIKSGSIKSSGDITDGYDKNVKENADNIANLDLTKVDKTTKINNVSLESDSITIDSSIIPFSKSDNTAVNKKITDIESDLDDTNDRIDTNVKTINTNALALVPIGAIIPYAGVLPTNKMELIGGFMACSGQTLSQTTYKDLYNVIGSTYTESSSIISAGQFKLPNLNSTGRFLRATGNNNGLGLEQEEALPNIIGSVGQDADSPTAQTGAFKEEHGWTSQFTNANAENTVTVNAVFSANRFNSTYGRDDPIKTPTTKEQFESVLASGSSTEVRPKSLTVNWLIRCK